MADRSWSQALRSPIASTVFAVVFGFGGLALAGSHTAENSGNGDGREHAPSAASDAGAHGAEVSALATSTDLVGWHKGAAISNLASDGKSQAGEHGPHAGEAPEDHASQGSQDDHGDGQQHASDHAEAGLAHVPSHPGQP